MRTVSLRRAVLACAAVAAAMFAVLGATGWWLAVDYDPPAYRRVDGHLSSPWADRWIHDLHVGAAITFEVAAIALAVLALLAALRSRPVAPSTWASGALAVAGAVALWTSRGLRWSVLGLWAVRIGRIGGVWSLAFGQQVRFFFFHEHLGPEVSPHTYQARVVGHLIAAPLLVLVAALFTALGTRHLTHRD